MEGDCFFIAVGEGMEGGCLLIRDGTLGPALSCSSGPPKHQWFLVVVLVRYPCDRTIIPPIPIPHRPPISPTSHRPSTEPAVLLMLLKDKTPVDDGDDEDDDDDDDDGGVGR